MAAQPFDYAPLLRSDLPPAAAKWAGFPKYNFVGGHNDSASVPVDGLIAAATSVLKREGRTLATYGLESGTSMAGPHVVGAVALMWSANPKLIGNIDQTVKILEDTARPYTGAPDSTGSCPGGQDLANEVGHGLLDAYAAVKEALREK